MRSQDFGKIKIKILAGKPLWDFGGACLQNYNGFKLGKSPVLTKEYRDVLEKFLENQNSTVALTIAPNVGRQAAHVLSRKLKTMMNAIDRGLYGQRYHLKPRTKGWFAIEKQESNAHMHGALCTTSAKIIEIENMLNEGLAKKIFGESTTHNVQKYRNGWAGYAIKSITDTECLIFIQ